MCALKLIQNNYWQVGILPETGASIAFGRIRMSGTWVDLMRPTMESDYINSSSCASFLLIPWSNRIRDGILRFRGQAYQLKTTRDDGTARHGDVRNRSWHIVSATRSSVHMSFHSTEYRDINFPFKFSAHVEYRLEGPDFAWQITLKNEDVVAFPASFGHHPYFLKMPGGEQNTVMLELPYDQQYELINAMPERGAFPVTSERDFRQLRKLDVVLDDLYTGKQTGKHLRIIYPLWNLEVTMICDDIFSHLVAFSPKGKPFFAVEPVTNANDGFNLHEQGIVGNGIFVLEPGQEQSGIVRLGLIQNF